MEMSKIMLLVRRQEGMSRAEFREYYEKNHAVLASRTMKKCVRYVRNYVVEEPGGEQDFDVITEFWFDDNIPGEQTYDQVLIDDELKFMDRASMRLATSGAEVCLDGAPQKTGIAGRYVFANS
jgi:uncharacterized protein (TIGR02118 family)